MNKKNLFPIPFLICALRRSETLFTTFCLSDITVSKLHWKTMVKKAVTSKFEELIKGKMKKRTKL